MYYCVRHGSVHVQGHCVQAFELLVLLGGQELL